MRFLAWLLTNAIALAVAAQLFKGISFSGPSTGTEEFRHKLVSLLAVALILGVVTAIVKPVVTILALPAVVLTLGLFLFVINALMLKLTAWLADGIGIDFTVEGFWTAVGGAVIITVVTWAVDRVLDN